MLPNGSAVNLPLDPDFKFEIDVSLINKCFYLHAKQVFYVNPILLNYLFRPYPTLKYSALFQHTARSFASLLGNPKFFFAPPRLSIHVARVLKEFQALKSIYL